MRCSLGYKAEVAGGRCLAFGQSVDLVIVHQVCNIVVAAHRVDEVVSPLTIPITIAANGDIYPCSKMLGLNDLGGIYRLGDLEQGITEVDARSQLIAMWGKKETKCITCDMADSCAGGCFADNYQATGSIFQPWETECCIVRRNLAVRRYAAQLLGVTARDEKAREECAV